MYKYEYIQNRLNTQILPTFVRKLHKKRERKENGERGKERERKKAQRLRKKGGRIRRRKNKKV